MESRSRTFDLAPAQRSRVPLWLSIIGPSGSGKTTSALRLATGFGGKIAVVDTENLRSTYYADRYSFEVVDFKPPFGPLDYLAAIKHCVSKGAATVVIDSMSHEWEGAGGVLESHDAECDRLAEAWKSTREKVQMSAWQRPKAEHRRMLNEMLQLGVNFILCYRAREKLKVIPNRPPQPLGWQPVGPDDLVYESALGILLYPGCEGVPVWDPGEQAERALAKRPAQFKDIFASKKPLDEETGRKLAAWAAGGQPAASPKASTETPETGTPAQRPTGPEALTPEMRLMLETVPTLFSATKSRQLQYISWASGRKVTDVRTLTDAEIDTVTRKGERGEVPE